MTDTSVQVVQHKSYMHDGILYHEYIGGVTINHILDAEKVSLELLKQQDKKTVPLIIVMKDIDESPFKLGLADYAKAITGLGLINHLSGIWLVTDSEEVRKGTSFVSKTFLGNRLQIVSTLEEAQVAARALITTTESILESK